MRKAVFAVLVVILVLLSLSMAFGEEPSLRSAPFSSSFIKYLEGVRSGAIEKNYGLIPLPLDLGRHKRDPHATRLAQPSRYDLRDLGYVTSVKDQDPYGTCWAFATFGSLESHLLVIGDGIYDFSERNLINLCYYDDPWNRGGNVFQSMAYLSRGDGPVLEYEDPYSLGPGASPILGRTLYVENVVVLPGRESVFDNDYIKDAIMTYGAVYTSMYFDNAFYDLPSMTYYCGVSGLEPNHAVVLVGWDDNMVVPGAPGPGVWIVKNSWGTAFGDNGYFYVSYYDLYIANHIAYFEDEDDINDGDFDVLYYDDLGLCDGLMYTGSSSIYGANVFYAPYDCYLEGVVLSLYDLGGGYVDYTVRVYVGYSTPPNVGSAAPDAVKTGRAEYTGYYTVRLNSPLYIGRGESFAVVIELRPQNPSNAYPLGIELRIPGVSSNVTISPGESFISSNGADWEDLYNYFLINNWGNVSLKAIVTSSYSPPPSGGGGGGGCSASGAGSLGLALLLLAPAVLALRRR